MEQVSEYIYFGFTYTHLTALLIGWFFILCISYFNDDYMHLNISCNYYAFYAYHINILHFVLWSDQTFSDIQSRQDRSWLCLYMGSHIFWRKVPTRIQLVSPQGGQVQ